MPLHWDDCGYLAERIQENVTYFGGDMEESEKEYYLALANRFRESMETGVVILDKPFFD